jgi:Zn-dependent peptidase ImmA (M78 family)
MKETIDLINPKMIVLARESRGISQSLLAKKVKISQGKLSKIENGILTITSEDEFKKFSATLGYPLSFFTRTENLYGVGLSEFFHRKRQSVPQRELNKIYAQLELRRFEITIFLQSVDIGETNFFKIDPDENNDDIESIAQSVRAVWRIPPGPIENVVDVIEEAGCIVVPFNFGKSNIDAISNWHPGLPPIIYINYNRPMDRIRFTLAHEVGHLIMHEKPPNNIEDIESQADRFASEFLMPKKEIYKLLNKLTLQKAAALKPFWKVSMAALIKRATDINKITERQSRYLWTQLGRAGYRSNEPGEIDVTYEYPKLLDEIVQVHKNDLLYDLGDLSSALNLNKDEFKSLYYFSDSSLRLVK